MDVATRFKIWKRKPDLFRGEIVRQFGDKLRELKRTFRKIGFP